MRVLVTRPEADAEETAERLKLLGYEPVVAPLLEIRLRAGPEIVLADVQAVLVTSVNGVRALARRTKTRAIKLLAVGKQSAETALALGFSKVENADGDEQALAELAARLLSPEKGVLLHACGRETRGNLQKRLAALGFRVRSEILYEAAAATRLPQLAEEVLRARSLGAALFFSPRTAAIFVELVSRARLGDACRGIYAVCLSAEVAEALQTLEFRDIRIAPRPRQDDLLAQIP